ncbi:unnamed protein product, partial [Didymodactylos carnosus]
QVRKKFGINLSNQYAPSSTATMTALIYQRIEEFFKQDTVSRISPDKSKHVSYKTANRLHLRNFGRTLDFAREIDLTDYISDDCVLLRFLKGYEEVEDLNGSILLTCLV